MLSRVIITRLVKVLRIVWRPPRKSRLTLKTTKSYAIIHTPQRFSELTHSSSEPSISIVVFLLI